MSAGGYDILMKILLVGEYCDKTAVLDQFADREESSSLGADVRSKRVTINGKTVQLQIWSLFLPRSSLTTCSHAVSLSVS